MSRDKGIQLQNEKNESPLDCPAQIKIDMQRGRDSNN